MVAIPNKCSAMQPPSAARRVAGVRDSSSLNGEPSRSSALVSLGGSGERKLKPAGGLCVAT